MRTTGGATSETIGSDGATRTLTGHVESPTVVGAVAAGAQGHSTIVSVCPLAIVSPLTTTVRPEIVRVPCDAVVKPGSPGVTEGPLQPVGTTRLSVPLETGVAAVYVNVRVFADEPARTGDGAST